VYLGFNGQLNPLSGSKHRQRLVLFLTKVAKLAAADHCLDNGKLNTLAAATLRDMITYDCSPSPCWVSTSSSFVSE
jgi:hypothetical protein